MAVNARNYFMDGYVGKSDSQSSVAAPCHKSLDALYDELDDRYQPTIATEYERLVVPFGSAETPVHRWFRMKEAYSPALLGQVLHDVQLSDGDHLRILDPFLGSGTTAASAMTLGLKHPPTVAGIEVNPFLGLLADVKVRALALPPDERSALATQVERQARQVLRPRPGPAPKPPQLHAFRQVKYFPSATIDRLMRMRANWLALDAGLARDVIAVALAASLEPSSNLRKDGRALRYESMKMAEDPTDAFSDRIGVIAEDLRSVEAHGTATVIRQSSLEVTAWSSLPHADGAWDLCLFSPPYPNNIDYTEVYKLEAWFLGLISDRDQFRRQRRQTFRSHPSVLFEARGPESLELPAKSLGVVQRQEAAILPAIPRDQYRNQRQRTVRGYLEDSAALLARAYHALRPGGHLVYVVGNSRHGTSDEFTVASDVLLADLGAAAGFEVTAVKVARDLHRRGRHDHLRESVVFLRRPS